MRYVLYGSDRLQRLNSPARDQHVRVRDEIEKMMSTALNIYTLGTDPPVTVSECRRSTVIEECLSDLAGEVATTQYVQNAEVDQREEAILSIETDLYRGAVTRVNF